MDGNDKIVSFEASKLLAFDFMSFSNEFQN